MVTTKVHPSPSCGEKTEQRRNLWISSETIELVKKRARARNRSKKAQLRKEIKWAVRKDKTMYYDGLAQEMIDADESGNLRKVYSAVKQLAGKRSAISETVKNADGHPVQDAKQWIEEWGNHFEKLLNRPPPATANLTKNLHNPLSEINTDPPTQWSTSSHKQAEKKQSRRVGQNTPRILHRRWYHIRKGADRTPTMYLDKMLHGIGMEDRGNCSPIQKRR